MCKFGLEYTGIVSYNQVNESYLLMGLLVDKPLEISKKKVFYINLKPIKDNNIEFRQYSPYKVDVYDDKTELHLAVRIYKNGSNGLSEYLSNKKMGEEVIISNFKLDDWSNSLKGDFDMHDILKKYDNILLLHAGSGVTVIHQMKQNIVDLYVDNKYGEKDRNIYECSINKSIKDKLPLSNSIEVEGKLLELKKERLYWQKNECYKRENYKDYLETINKNLKKDRKTIVITVGPESFNSFNKNYCEQNELEFVEFYSNHEHQH